MRFEVDLKVLIGYCKQQINTLSTKDLYGYILNYLGLPIGFEDRDLEEEGYVLENVYEKLLPLLEDFFFLYAYQKGLSFKTYREANGPDDEDLYLVDEEGNELCLYPGSGVFLREYLSDPSYDTGLPADVKAYVLKNTKTRTK